MRYIALLVLTVLLVACGECKVPRNKAAVAPIAGDCTNTPAMTNDEIITTTAQCTAAGLGAEALHCGDNKTTIIIQCTPEAVAK